ncbi:hypothetical protein MKX03_032252, partial [Papaver bracteatum]
MDYMNGKELRWPKFDGDYLNLKDLLDSVHDCIEHLDGAQCLFHYLEDGFLYDIDEEKDLLKFWEESDQDVPNEVHLFMTYNKAMNVLKPGEPLVPPVVVSDEVGEESVLALPTVDDEVVEPPTQSQHEAPVIRDWESLDDEFWKTTLDEEEDILSSHTSQHTSQVDMAPQDTTQHTPDDTPHHTSQVDMP